MSCKHQSQKPLADVARRLEQFFMIADLRCADSGEWLGDPQAFGIQNGAEWAARMGAEMLWISANSKQVLEALPLLDDEWASCCDAVKGFLGMAG